MFIQLHTLKGIARAYTLQELVELHYASSIWMTYVWGVRDWKLEEFTRLLTGLKTSHDVYVDVIDLLSDLEIIERWEIILI